MNKDLEDRVDTIPPPADGSVNDGAETESKTSEELTEQLLKLQKENQKNHDNYLRALAEVENIKKRSIRDREEYLKYANLEMAKKLLPIIDDLYRAIEMASTARDVEAMGKGIEMVTANLKEMLKGEGVTAIESLGKEFDPQYHEALTVEPSEKHPENTIMEEFQTGYVMHDRVIRPSLVKVSS